MSSLCISLLFFFAECFTPFLRSFQFISWIIFSISSVVFGLAGPPNHSLTLNPLKKYGLCEAVIATPPESFSFVMKNETAGVGVILSERKTFTPSSVITRAENSANSSERNLASYPTTTSGFLNFAFRNFAKATDTFLTFSNVKSSAIFARHPSVPNFIIFYVGKERKIIKQK